MKTSPVCVYLQILQYDELWTLDEAVRNIGSSIGRGRVWGCSWSESPFLTTLILIWSIVNFIPMMPLSLMHTFMTRPVLLLVMHYASTSCLLIVFSFHKGVRRGWPSGLTFIPYNLPVQSTHSPHIKSTCTETYSPYSSVVQKMLSTKNVIPWELEIQWYDIMIWRPNPRREELLYM